MEHQTTANRRGVDVLLHTAQADAGGVQLLDEMDQILERATEPIQSPDDDGVTRT